MKNLILGIAVLGLAIACKNTDNTSVTDGATANAPSAESECCASESSCEGADASECAGAAAADCDGGGCEAAEAQVCPVTGEKVEN